MDIKNTSKPEVVELDREIDQMSQEELDESSNNDETKIWEHLLGGLVIVAALGGGFLVAEIACVINHASFGAYLWPIILSSDVFGIATIGYFNSDQGIEKLYGLCAAVSLMALVVQFGILF